MIEEETNVVAIRVPNEEEEEQLVHLSRRFSSADIHDKTPSRLVLGRPRAVSWSSDNPRQALVYLAIWYTFSTTATFINKILIKHDGVPAEMLTMSHLIVSSICDAIILWTPENSRFKLWSFRPISLQGLVRLAPLSIIVVSAKMLTYISYSKVPVSVAHTCKASAPLFNVLLAWALFSKKFSSFVYLSLVPIVIGVSMASVSEVKLNDLAVVGVTCAILSAMCGVIQSMYAKHLLRDGYVSDSINLHFYNGLICALVNLPLLFRNYDFTTGKQIFVNIPYTKMILCSLIQFIGSIVSSLLLGKVTELTYSIMGTMKRVVIIIGAIIYFSNPVTLQSAFGMMLAISGVGYYRWAKSLN